MEARHQLAQCGDEGLLRFGGLPRAIDNRLPFAGSQNEKRILAEERIAAHVLAALHGFEEECVIGVLGNLQERGDRRQQIRNDFLVDGNKRAPLRQLPEFFERCYAHTTSPTRTREARRRGALHIERLRAFVSPWFVSADGAVHHAWLWLVPRPPLELPLRLRDEHRQTVERHASGRARLAQQRTLLVTITEVVDKHAGAPNTRERAAPPR